MRRFIRPALVVPFLAVLASASFAEEIGPGSPAPKLEISKWFKGVPVSGFDKDKTYVVEFWATWCGPCKQSIPHLTEMAKSNPDVTFIGVDAFEDDKDNNIQKFVDDMGEKMNYNVGYTGNRDHMAKTWMMDANQGGIPTAFVVKGGQIQWIGHPMEMEKPLAQIKAGTFDLAGFKAEFAKQAEAMKASRAADVALSDCDKLFTSGKHAEAKAQLSEVVKKYPSVERSAEAIKFSWLGEEDPKAWQVEAKRLATSKSGADRQRLLGYALRQAKHPGAAFERGVMALSLVEKATDGKDFLTLQYAASFYAQAGDAKNELDSVRKINDLIPSTPYKDQSDMVKYWQTRQKDLEAKLHS